MSLVVDHGKAPKGGSYEYAVLPQTDETGHGFGTQSIRYVAEKLNGNCRFSAEKGMFVLQVVI